jgi:hypothetical protein
MVWSTVSRLGEHRQWTATYSSTAMVNVRPTGMISVIHIFFQIVIFCVLSTTFPLCHSSPQMIKR